MAKKTTKFEERLARIAQQSGATSVSRSLQSKLDDDERPRLRFSFRRAFLLPSIVVPVLFVAQLNDNLFVAFAKRVAAAETAGRTTLATVLASDTLSGADRANALAVKKAKHRLAHEELSPEAENSLRAIIRAYEGKSAADLSRESMVLELTRRARTQGDAAMAQRIEDQLNACRSTLCLDTVYSIAVMDLDTLSQ
ncbi:hypothetical protein [Pseudoponticoccus marisrubri]|uniref:Uncharacterized protein n=1 Tax=Pseudoponticoccus marisrubri TaxID=1685382 RepID=A0A0W7WGH5_9RHOB|nr:hypothetical protein [Pseudoponticoccus marisrubri]KUF09731.1 hypothetical protein AVJ23_16390 [Pseudoponticoccus marisrubri]